MLAAWALAGGLLWWHYHQAMIQQARYLLTWAPASAQAGSLVRAQAGASEAINNAVISSRVPHPDHLAQLRGQMQSSILRLDALLARGTVERPLLDHATATQRSWLMEDFEPTLKALVDGDPSRAARITASSTSGARMEAMQLASARLQSHVQWRSLEQSQSMASSAKSLRDVFFISMGLLIAAIAVGALGIRLGVVRPLDWVRVNVQRAARDPDHQHPITAVGPVDIAALATDAEGMRRELVAEIDHARAAQSALNAHAPLVAEMRQRLHGEPVPVLDGMSIFASTHPSEGVIGGDWWQFATRSDGTWCVILADVSGHGWECGLVALQMKAAIESWIRTDIPLETVAEMASGFLWSGEHTVSLVLIELHVSQNRMHYLNAGHPPPMVIDQDGSMRELHRTGPLLSCLSAGSESWTSAALAWSPGSALFAYSDGLLDAIDSGAGEIGAVLQSAVTASTPTPGDASEIGSRVLGSISLASLARSDDTSLLVITRPSDRTKT